MEFLIFSDSHGRSDSMQEALSRQVGRLDGVCFLGDGLRDAEHLELGAGVTLSAVRGNCDWGSSFGLYPVESTFSAEGHTVFLTHGHIYGVKGGYGAILSRAVSVSADIVLFGHTHLPHLQTFPVDSEIGGVRLSRPLYLFNPGSIGYNEDGKGYAFGTLLLRRETVLFSHGRI